MEQPVIRNEVLDYVQACVNVLKGDDGAHDEFMLASETLQQKEGNYTDEKMALVQEMMRRVSNKHGG